MSAIMSPSSSPTRCAQARDAAEKIEVDYAELPAVVDPATAAKPGRSRNSTTSRRTTRSINWHLGDKAATDAAFASADACHQARPRQQPAGPERDGAARGDRRIRFAAPTRSRSTRPARTRMSRGSSSSAFVGTGARAQAARHRARCRRRLRLEDLHLPRGDRLRLGGARRSTGRSNGRADRTEASSPTRMAAITSPTPSWRSTRDGKITGLRVHTIANLGAYMSTFSSSVPTYLYAPRCCRASTTSRTSIARSTRSTPTPCRSTPIAARAGRRRPSWSSGMVEARRSRDADGTPAEFRRQNFVKSFPHQTPVIMRL